MSEYDAVVVGSGPNGLAAAIAMAQAGRSVLVVEAEHQLGGGARTFELTLPGFRHDICSAAHPLGFASPFFRKLPLAEHGLEWIHPPLSLAHPLDTGEAGVLDQVGRRHCRQIGQRRTGVQTLDGRLRRALGRRIGRRACAPHSHSETSPAHGAFGLVRRPFRRRIIEIAVPRKTRRRRFWRVLPPMPERRSPTLFPARSA